VTSSSFEPPTKPPGVHPVVVADELVPNRRGTVAVLAHVKRDGDWTLPRLFRAFALWGNAEVDLTRAQIGAGTSHIEIKSIMGNVTVLVPPEIRIECDVDPVIGSFEVAREAESTRSPDAPLVRITGTAFMGAVEVKVIRPECPELVREAPCTMDSGSWLAAIVVIPTSSASPRSPRLTRDSH
jgi:Cell wall-active antibiotics response LiaF, C-terminal